MRLPLSRFRRWSAGALTGATALGALALVGGPASATTTGATAGAEPPTFVNAGATAQSASPWLVKVPNTFVAGDTITLQVTDHNAGSPLNCSVANQFVGFSATPTVSVTADSANTGTTDTAPTVTPSISTASGEPNCTSQNVKDLLTLTFGNTATGTAADAYDIVVNGVKYDVGSAAAQGTVAVQFQGGSWSTTAGDSQPSSGASSFVAGLDGKLSNATVEQVAVKASVPPTGLNLAAPSHSVTNAPISPVTITENSAGQVGTGWVCLSFSNSPTIDTTSHSPSVSVSGGGAAVSSATPTVSGSTVAFQVTTASSTAAATYTVSNLNVDTTHTGPSFVTVKIDGTTSSCGTSTTLSEAPAAFDGIDTQRLAGATVDDTAVQELNAFSSGCSGVTGLDNVVLARDDSPYDALAGAFMAGVLSTGTLLTPGGPGVASVSNAAMNAIRTEGVQTVYVLGGPLALPDAVVNQLQNTPSYDCGGTTPRASGGVTQMLRVVRVFGQTADGTASAVAQYFGAGPSGYQYSSRQDLAGAYTGAYNDTTGAESSAAPKGASLYTAVVATDNSWQDAVSAGPAAWTYGFPVVLTPTGSLGTDAQNALVNLGIQQVIVMGGPLAVSDNVVSQLQALGITVIRAAGQDYTDTSQLFARFMQTSTSNANGDPEGLNHVDDARQFINISRGDYFGDALAGADAAGYCAFGPDYGCPVLLTMDPNTLGQYLTAFLNASGVPGIGTTGLGDTRDVTYFGGSLALTPATIQNSLNAIAAGNNG